MSSSDPVDLQIDSAGAMIFTFYNILLPDSNVDQAGSNGFVIYKVRPRVGIPDPTVIYNTAVANATELKDWEQPLKSTWLAKYLITV